MPTLAEIAKQAGVSTAVVSKIVNKDKSLRVSSVTRSRVEKVIHQTGYTPNRSARSLRSTETGMFALVVHDVTNPVYAEITKGAHAAATEAGKAILLIDAAAGDAAMANVVDLVRGRGVDGVILQAAQENSDTLITQAAREKVPTVLLQAQIEDELPVVTLQDREAALLGTQHLIDQGHRDIACLATRAGLSFTEARVEGWQAAMRQANLSCDGQQIVFAEPTIEDGALAFPKLRGGSFRPTAIMCCNVLSAIGAMNAAIKDGLRVPEDLAFVGIHDVPMAQYCCVPLTTVWTPLFDLGKASVELLLKNDPPKNQHIEIPQVGRLVRRKSS